MSILIISTGSNFRLLSDVSLARMPTPEIKVLADTAPNLTRLLADVPYIQSKMGFNDASIVPQLGLGLQFF